MGGTYGFWQLIGSQCLEVELVTRKENREYGIDLEKNICPQFDRLKLKYQQDTQEDFLREVPILKKDLGYSVSAII